MRNKGIDLSRIVLMVFITFHHIIVINYGLYSTPEILSSLDRSVLITFNSFLICSVNVFFLISGYFSIKPNSKKIISFVLYAFFYHFVTTMIGLVLGRVSIDFNTIKHIFVQSENYWFIFVYCILYFISPCLNSLIAIKAINLSKLLVFVLFIGCHNILFNNSNLGWVLGYSLCQAVCMYLIGSKLKEIPDDSILYKYSFTIYAIGCIILSFSSIVLFHFVPNAKVLERMFSYSNPIIVLNSICFFISFKKLIIDKLPDRVLNTIRYLSKHSLAAYLILNGNWILSYIKEVVPTNKFWFGFGINIILAIMLSIFAMIIDFLLKNIMGGFVDTANGYIGNMLKRIMTTFNVLLDKFIGISEDRNG